MNTVRFIHAADIHLDTPFRGLSAWNSELAVRLKEATFQSFGRIVDLCIRERVDFLVVSGDIFDGEDRSLAAQLRFVAELKRLSVKGIATYLVCGNHDPLSSWLDTLQMPPLVHRFGAAEVERLSHEKEGKKAADIYGISFPDREVKENLALRYRPGPGPAPVAVAVLHGTVGSPGPHHSYAPFSLDDIRGMGFDYWALGHIHRHQVVSAASPAVVYPGNPQGRDFGETGPKGCCLVEISPGQAPRISFMPTQVIRFAEAEAGLNGVQDIADLEKRMTQVLEELKRSTGNVATPDDGCSLMVRLTLTGRTPLHAQLRRAGETRQLQQLFNEGQLLRPQFLWIDRIDVQTQPDVDLDQVRSRNDFTAEILKAFEAAGNDPEKLSGLVSDMEEAFGSHEAKRELTGFSRQEQSEMLEKAKWMLLDKLLQESA